MFPTIPAYRRYATPINGCIPYGMQGNNEPLFSTERYIPSECFAANENVNYFTQTIPILKIRNKGIRERGEWYCFATEGA